MAKQTQHYVAFHHSKRLRTVYGISWTIVSRGFTSRAEANKHLSAHQLTNTDRHREYFLVSRTEEVQS